MKKVSMQDIANSLGVSKVTVSKAFKDNNDISENMRNKVLSKARELGYKYTVPNQKYVSIITSSLFLEKDENFYTGIYKLISEHSERHHLQPILSIVTEDNQESLVKPNIFNTEKISATIILGQLKKKYVKMIESLGIPMILLDFSYKDVDADMIVSNNYYASYEITNHLIEKGHKRIGFVGNKHTTTSVQDRYLGYIKALLENNLEQNEDYIINDRDNDLKSIPIKFNNNLPSAFVCNNDLTAHRVIEELNALGYNVPKDISVVGFDDIQYSQFSEPGLSTVRVNREEMAKLAIKRVMKRIEDKNAERKRFVVESEIILRNSVENHIQ